MHTIFKLSANVEYLALVDNFWEWLSEFNPFSALDDDQSFGFYDGTYIVFNKVSQGLLNTLSPITDFPLPFLVANMDFMKHLLS